MELHPFLLIFELRRTIDILESELLARLEATGRPRMTINQVLLFAHLEPDGVTPAELARRMGMARQSMQKNLDRLEALRLVELRAHPQDRRSHLVIHTSAGLDFARAVALVLDGFERRIEAALGTDAVNQARTVLIADLGGILRTDQNASGR